MAKYRKTLTAAKPKLSVFTETLQFCLISSRNKFNGNVIKATAPK